MTANIHTDLNVKGRVVSDAQGVMLGLVSSLPDPVPSAGTIVVCDKTFYASDGTGWTALGPMVGDTVDPTVTPTSQNPVQSKGIYDAIQDEVSARQSADVALDARVVSNRSDITTLQAEMVGLSPIWLFDAVQRTFLRSSVVLTAKQLAEYTAGRLQKDVIVEYPVHLPTGEDITVYLGI